jgi:apolipoprotein D and lipocalin family protein
MTDARNSPRRGLRRMATRCVSALLALLGLGCAGLPEGIRPVEGFELDRYLGTWYEIARLDHSFERGLTRVTAEYTLREGGGVRVVNRGYLPGEGRWKEAVGKAFFVEGPHRGYLKVSFFGPFYGSYIVADLDRENYRYALICGPSRSYLWILARSPELEPEVRDRLVAKAAALGFDTSKLIFVEQRGSVLSSCARRRRNEGAAPVPAT